MPSPSRNSRTARRHLAAAAASTVTSAQHLSHETPGQCLKTSEAALASSREQRQLCNGPNLAFAYSAAYPLYPHQAGLHHLLASTFPTAPSAYSTILISSNCHRRLTLTRLLASDMVFGISTGLAPRMVASLVIFRGHTWAHSWRPYRKGLGSGMASAWRQRARQFRSMLGQYRAPRGSVSGAHLGRTDCKAWRSNTMQKPARAQVDDLLLTRL
jgi:hypothetical protein